MQKLFASTLNTRPLLSGSLRFIRSDVPDRITRAEIDHLLSCDIRTIVDLRTPQERAARPCPLQDCEGFSYLCMPVTGGNAVPASPQEVGPSYLRMVDAQMQRILHAILTADSNVLYFCNAGKDRTGVLSALLLQHLGAEREAIVADYLLSAHNLRDTLQAYADANPQADLRVITPQRSYIEAVLDACPKDPYRPKS